MAPWLRVLEAYAVQALLRTPAFHRGVEKVAKQVHRIRHGLPYEEPGGTNLSDHSRPGFGKHFIDELRGQIHQAERERLDGAARTRGVTDNSVNARGAVGDADAHRADKVWQNMRQKAGQTSGKNAAEEQADAEAAWRETQSKLNQQPKAGFLSAYVNAMKEQIGNGKPPR